MTGIIAERLIKKAMDEGDFDPTMGKGKPLEILSSPFLDSEWDLSFHILKNAGMRPYWLELDLEIRQRMEESLRSLIDAASIYSTDSLEWEVCVKRFRQRTEEVNQLIQELNLKVPHSRFQRTLLKPDREIGKILASSRNK
jgi:hypothetical protein